MRAFSFMFEGGLIGPASRMNLAPAGGGGAPIPLTGEWRYRIEHDIGNVVNVRLTGGPGSQHSPYILYDNMIAPLVPYGMRGVLWYQGESNEGNAGQYARLMTDLIRDWRHVWGQGEFPFLFVQLANFRLEKAFDAASGWARVREAQFQALRRTPRAGMAVITDVGEALDIHPRNKQVAVRYAWADNPAGANLYNAEGLPASPFRTDAW